MSTAEPLGFSSEVESLRQHLPQWGSDVGGVFAHAFGGAPSSWPFILAAMVVAGFVVEWLACRRITAVRERMQHAETDTWYVALGYAAFRLLFAFGGIAVSGVAAWLVLLASLDSATPIYGALKELLIAVIVLRCCIAGAGVVFSPAAEGIRPMKLSTPDARVLFRWVVGFSAVYVLLGYILHLLRHGDMTPVLERATIAILGSSLIVVLLVFIWSNRALVERLFTDAERPEAGPSMLRETLVQSWPYIASAWLVLLWVAWAYAVFTADAGRLESVRTSWWVTILFPLADRLLHAGLERFVLLPFLQSPTFAKRRARFLRTMQIGLRIVFALVAVVALAVTWKFAGTDRFFEAWGERLVDAAINFGGTLLIAYVLYEVVMAWLEKKMPQEERNPAAMGGEPGGVGATREQTLAPLLRSVFMFLLVIVVVLATLHSLGVQILPLLAGAGILGLAIGFGAQKLVQDIISGIFFLVDDAFRIGEYVEVGDVKGVVEKISIRSFQLRHHNGPLNTVPFGEIRNLKNFSRDWAMMKLKLRVSYDTDVDRVRKLIKKLGQDLLEDPEIGPLFLQPLKSQGVYSMEDDSAIIIRVKFMTRPGDQFIVRRVVYARLQELFEREGIEVPNRVVTVRVDDASGEMDEQRKREIAGAAIAAGAQRE